jgi:hypothetical protein
VEQPPYVTPRSDCGPTRAGRFADKDFPGASAIAYGAIATFILAVRYLDIIRWGFKLTWMVLGITLAAEVVGKTLLNSGLATQVRPRKYYTVPKETLDAVIGDVNELVNFFVIEAQRILFAENIPASAVVSLTTPGQ